MGGTTVAAAAARASRVCWTCWEGNWGEGPDLVLRWLAHPGRLGVLFSVFCVGLAIC